MDAEPFRSRLVSWFQAGHRDLPWRRTRDPYRIWLSEIMLQQTRTAAAIPYYERFLKRFPTAEALASSSESDVLAAWSGLGYYSRARNVRASAARIVERGNFPTEFDAIRELPGVGPYTAAAIASIAFGLPHAVLDGNVLRVVARVSNDAGDIGSPATQRRFQALADDWLDRARPGEFNQAMMELGATVCLPRQPLCLVCPVGALCQARQAGTQEQLPVKLKKAKPERVASEVVIIERDRRVLLRKRTADARRMAGFWELPEMAEVPGASEEMLLGPVTHTIVNERHEVLIYRANMEDGPLPAGMGWVDYDSFPEIPITTVTRKALKLYANC